MRIRKGDFFMTTYLTIDIYTVCEVYSTLMHGAHFCRIYTFDSLDLPAS